MPYSPRAKESAHGNFRTRAYQISSLKDVVIKGSFYKDQIQLSTTDVSLTIPNLKQITGRQSCEATLCSSLEIWMDRI